MQARLGAAPWAAGGSAGSADRSLGFKTAAGPARLVGVHGRDDRALAQHAPDRLCSARKPRGRHGAP